MRKTSISALLKRKAIRNLMFLMSILLSFKAIGHEYTGHRADDKEKKITALREQFQVKGEITDANTDEPIPGVNVVVAGTTKGTTSDMNGQYQLLLDSPQATIEFSFVGYTTQAVDVNGQSIIDVQLEEEVKSLGEVVVVGYGSMERTNVTGAISSVKTEEILKNPVPNVVEALRGQVPGVRITRTNGRPGSGVEFTIRGKNSIGNDDDEISENEPLIVIDGVPLTGGNLAEINPEDIASIDILKDAAAASIYGSSGANGVILITTKRGIIGKPSLTVSLDYGFTDLSQKPPLFDANGYVQLKKNAAEGAGADTALSSVLNDPVESANYAEGKEIDWHDVMLRQGNTKNVSLALSGGTEKFNYYMNGDAYLEEGIVEHTDYNRYSLRLNTEYNPFKFLTVGARTQLTKSFADETGNSAVLYQELPDFTDFLGNSPLGRLRNDEGELVPTVKGDQFQYNPLYRYANSEAERQNSRTYINPYIEFKIINGLTLKINGFAEQRNERFRRFRSSKYYFSVLGEEPGNNELEVELGQSTTYLLDNILNYHKTFFNKHAIDATLVYGLQTFDSYILRATGEGSPTDLLGTYSLNDVPSANSDVVIDPDNTNFINQKDPQWGKVYYVGRLGYSYDRRYNLTLTMRRDGSSKFGANNKFGNFPSASFAWNLHNESFLENNALINWLKYRASYGVMGNDNIPTFGYISLTQSASYAFDQIVYTGLTTGTAPNESLRWEKSKQFNTGIDFGILNNRLSGSVDYYQTNTTDLLLEEQISIVSGFASVISNVGETRNWGIDANLTGRLNFGDFGWEISVNWAKDQNEIVRLSSADVDAEGNPIDDEANGWFIGQDIDVIYDHKFLGIYQLGEEDVAATMHPDKRFYGAGDPKIEDISGPEGVPDGVITFDDRTFLGSPTPDWYGGLRNTFSFKGLEITVLFESVQGVTKIDRFVGSLTGRDNNIEVDYWTPRNPSNEYPQPNQRSTYFYEDAVRVKDASFTALRNVSFGYSLPTSILNKTPMKNLMVYVRGNNLKYWTDFVNAYSPDSELGAFPTIKSWVFGTKIIF